MLLVLAVGALLWWLGRKWAAAGPVLAAAAEVGGLCFIVAMLADWLGPTRPPKPRPREGGPPGPGNWGNP